jgi:hypothetical protein
MLFGDLLSLTPIFKAVGGKQLHHNHGRRRQKLSPHMTSNFGRIPVGLTGNDAPSKRIFFSCNEGVYHP